MMIRVASVFYAVNDNDNKGDGDGMDGGDERMREKREFLFKIISFTIIYLVTVVHVSQHHVSNISTIQYNLRN